MPYALVLTLVFSLVLTACGTSEKPVGSATSPIGGTMVVSAAADADLLLPPVALTGTALQVVDAVFDRLLQPGIDSTGALALEPALASAWAFSGDSSAIDFTLDARAKWHDGTPVTAEDVRFTFVAYRDSVLGSPSRAALADIDSVEVRGPQAVRFWLRVTNARSVHLAGTEMRIMPRHLLDSLPRASWRTADVARRPMGSGRFRFVSWQAGSRIEVVADSTNYRGRPMLDRVVWSIAPDPTATIARIKTGDADFLENVRPDAVPELAATPSVRVLRSTGLAYGYVQWNLLTPGSDLRPHPLFGDRAIRMALARAIPRDSIVRTVFDSLAEVAVGPFTRLHLANARIDRGALPNLTFDTTLAARALDSLGWRRGNDGMRMRAGVPLRFTLLVPASSTVRVRLATLMQPHWRALGVDARVESLEFPAFMARLAAGDFDAAVMALGADIDPLGIRGVWGSGAARQQGGPNFGSYRSSAFDAALDRAAAQRDEAAMQRAMVDAWRLILDDAPALWLFEPYTVSAVRREITPVGIRPDAWWSQLADWSRSTP